MKHEHIEGTKTPEDNTDQIVLSESKVQRRKENIADTVRDMEEDYNRCYRIIRKTYEYLEKLGLRDFNKFSKYKWSFDRDNRGFSYVCVRAGSSLIKKSLIKRSGNLKEAELFQWIDNKELVCEALEEAFEYIDEKLSKLKIKMGEMKEEIQGYENRLDGVEQDFDGLKASKEIH